MSWYAAHIIIYLKYFEEAQTDFDVQENIVLIEATSTEEALDIAKTLGKRYEVVTTIGLENKPARWIYGGIRKIVECQNVEGESLKQTVGYKPWHGTEVSYSLLRVRGVEALENLLSGEPVEVSLDSTLPLTQEEINEIGSIYNRETNS